MKRLVLVALLALMLGFSTLAQATLYDLSGDWKTSPPWSYALSWDKMTSDNPGSWAAGDVVVGLGAYPAADMVYWTSPANGTISITGAAWYISGATASVYLQLVPASIAGNLSGSDWQTYVRMTGTTSLANGTVQSGLSSFDHKTGFGTSSYIPLRDVSSLANLTVQAGDVIALMVQNGNTQSGSTVGAQLTINETLTPVPIPSAILLFAPGLVGLAMVRRRFKK